MATAKEIGIGIKNARLTVGITQAELARRLGVTPQAISQYERGEKSLKLKQSKNSRCIGCKLVSTISS